MPSLLFYRSDGTSVISENRFKYLTPCVPPFKVTQGHRNRHGSIRHLRLPILTFHSNHGPHTVSGINGDFSRKSQISPPLVTYITPPIRAFTLNWVTALGLKKLEGWGYMAEKKFDDIFSRLDTIHKCGRQRDGRIDTERQQRPRLRIASRSKKDSY